MMRHLKLNLEEGDDNDANLTLLQTDSYRWLLNADILEGKMLVLLDPPYDSVHSYHVWNLFIMKHLRHRWPSASVALWYPIIDDVQTQNFHQRLAGLGEDVLVAEIQVQRPYEEQQSHAGMALLAAPEELQSTLECEVSALAKMLASSPCERNVREHVSGVAQSAAVLSLTSGVLGSFPGASRTGSKTSGALPIKPRSVSICESSMGGTSLPIRSRSDTGSSLTLPIKGRSVSESACDADRPASGLALPIRSRSSLEPGRSGLELPIAGRSVVASADRKRSEVREEGPCAAGARTEPATQATAASCGVALLNCVFSDWDSEESKSPMTKAKSNPQLTGSPGDETPDRYDFGELLGEGAAGSTWEAFPRVRETRSGTRARRLSGQERPRAIKKVPKRRVSNSTESFLAEVEEVFEDADNIFLVMELCRGGELFDRITQGELGGEAQVAKLIQQLAHAVRYCHDRGIIHRDIKPENILFVSPEPDAPAKLIDFGIACHFKQTEHRRDEKGTEAYLAPEVKDNSSYTEKCDLWSLGVLLYAMLSPGASLGHQSARRKNEVTASLEEEAVPVKVQVRLRRYQSTSYFRRILLLVVARQLGANDLPEIYKTFKAHHDRAGEADELSELFEALDADGSGAIDYSPVALEDSGDSEGDEVGDQGEFMAAAIDRKIFFREELCLQVFAALDRDSSGTISIQERVLPVLLRRSRSSAGISSTNFLTVDWITELARERSVSPEELFQLLKAADPEDLLGNELRDEVMELLDRYDTDRDGELSFREFRALLTQNREGSPPKRLQKRVSQGSDLMTKSPSY
eukprot:g15213.t1